MSTLRYSYKISVIFTKSKSLRPRHLIFAHKDLDNLGLGGCGSASHYRSRGPVFESTCSRFETWSISFTSTFVHINFRSHQLSFTSTFVHINFRSHQLSFTSTCLRLSEDTVKAVGPFYLLYILGEIKDPTRGNKKN